MNIKDLLNIIQVNIFNLINDFKQRKLYIYVMIRIKFI